LAESGLAILGGEIYQTNRKGDWGWGTYVRSWDTLEFWSPSERWSEFIARAAAQTRGELEADNLAWADEQTKQADDAIERRLYFLANMSEGDFRQECKLYQDR
jgi:hypothetical protein